MKNNKKGITLIALIITIIILVILAGVSMTAIFGDNGVVSNAMKIELETSKGEIRDHLLLKLNDELLSCSADIYGTSEDISTRFNEIKLINYLAGHKNFAGTDHEDKSATSCVIEKLNSAVKIKPKGGNINDLKIEDQDDGGSVYKDLVTTKKLITSDNEIYNQYRIIPENVSAEVDKYGLGTTIADKDIFTLEAVTDNGTKITDSNADSSGKYQIIYYPKEGAAIVLETVSLYISNQSN